MTRCGRQFTTSVSQGNTMVFYDSAEEEEDQQQDEEVFDDEAIPTNEEEEEEEIENCNIPEYVATKEYVNDQLEHARQLSAQDASIALHHELHQVKLKLQSVSDTQSRCLRQWTVNDAFNADLYRISNTAPPQDEKDVANKAYVDRHINIIKTHLAKIPKLRCSKLGNVNVMKKRLVNVAPPVRKEDGATKAYVDEKIKKEIAKLRV
ncbi:hypothetical protein R5R35_010597 [Gryllus longicercus]|uniref:Uncharacterized protein n=1 Tax=Gryllus longicercus TaxID=2509291 RepID=A0AAN9VAL1_9ORTH